ncbi:MAG: hypothetical protein ABI793_01255 [Flavobacterium sp.]
MLVENSENEIQITCPELLNPTGDRFLKDIDVTDNYKCNGIYYFVNRATIPKFPIRFTIKSTSGIPIKFVGVMKAVGENSIRLIPLIPQ